MARSGRFGKYGDLKRKEKLRQNKTLRNTLQTSKSSLRAAKHKKPTNG